MELKIQVLLMFVSFLFGIIYCLAFKIYQKFFYKIKYKILLDFIFNIFFFTLLSICLYLLNRLYLHIYMIFFFTLGMCICYVNKKKK